VEEGLSLRRCKDYNKQMTLLGDSGRTRVAQCMWLVVIRSTHTRQLSSFTNSPLNVLFAWLCTSHCRHAR
jgi:hypothetical protein